jgi:SAM-dependent methyltransferase
MAKLGGDRMKNLVGRFDYAICDFSQSGWTDAINIQFDAIVSSIAIHNVRDPDIMQRIYQDAYTLLNPGGCFVNFDRPRPPWEEQIKWLRAVGFKNVQIFWQQDNRAVFGGFK